MSKRFMADLQCSHSLRKGVMCQVHNRGLLLMFALCSPKINARANSFRARLGSTFARPRLPTNAAMSLALVLSGTGYRAPSLCNLVAQRRPTAIQVGEHTSELQSRQYLVCRLLLEK